MKVKSGLRKSLLRMILFPLILLGIIIIAYSSYYLTVLVYQEVKTELKGVAQSAVFTYENEFTGGYRLENGSAVYKGIRNIKEASDILEGYKKMFGADITLFYGDRRIATTIRNKNGEPIVGTKANDNVVEEVLKRQAEQFYSHTNINSNKYVSYYCPLFDPVGNCVGMMFAGKEVSHVRGIVFRGLMPVVVAIFVSVAVVVLIMWLYASKLIKCMQQLGDFFLKVESGDLKTELGTLVLNREDELGRIGMSALQMQSSLRDLIERDALTGLYNRHYGEEFLWEAQKELLSRRTPFYVAIGDIDFFKQFNDEHGHDCGDLVLREISAILRQSVQDMGSVARWGGEEFLFVLSGKHIEDVEQFINDIAREVRNRKIEYGGQILSVTMTFGVTNGDGDMHTDEIVKKADEALYMGKQTGRDKVVYKH